MFRSLVAALVLFVPTATSTFGGDQPDEKAIEGKWQVVKVASGLGPAPIPDMTPVFIFKGGRFTVEIPNQKSSEGRLSLDATKKPKHINMHIEADQNQQVVGKVVEGLYAFRDGKLLLCIKEPGKGRPTEFEAPAGQMQILATLERVEQ